MRAKEFLSARGVEYQSIDIAGDPEGLAELEALGLRSVPVVARGGDYVFAQDLNHVARFVGLDYAVSPQLAPGELVVRLERILRAALRFGGQIPRERLDDRLPNRDRSYLALLNHVAEIAAGFVEIARGASMTGAIGGAVPEVELDVPDLRPRADEIIEALHQWWHANQDHPECAGDVETYYGPQSLHAVLERTTWHCGQHVRQLMMVLELLDIPP
ncbi:MAG: glutaredoxin family protein, partial [Pseudomonadales bacterium]